MGHIWCVTVSPSLCLSALLLLVLVAQCNAVDELSTTTPMRLSLPVPSQLQQSQGAERREGVEICENECHEINGSKGTANFIMKWAKDDRKQCTINIEHVKKFTRAYGGELPPPLAPPALLP